MLFDVYVKSCWAIFINSSFELEQAEWERIVIF